MAAPLVLARTSVPAETLVFPVKVLVPATVIDPPVALTVKDGVGFTRSEFCQFLEANKIQTRPYFAGNIMLQPAYEGIMDAEQVIKDFPVARKVTTDTFFLGCSPVITEEQIEYIETIINKFFTELK